MISTEEFIPSQTSFIRQMTGSLPLQRADFKPVWVTQLTLLLSGSHAFYKTQILKKQLCISITIQRYMGHTNNKYKITLNKNISYISQILLFSDFSSLNCDEIQVKAHFRFVSIYLRALVQCSSELNCILMEYACGGEAVSSIFPLSMR